MDRLFLAAPLTDAARAALRAAVDASFPNGLPGRATPSANWHLTLRFLGESAPDRADAFVAELASVLDEASFDVAFAGYGAFPRASRAAVLWLGVRAGAEPLGRLAAMAEGAARRAGFPPEERPFSPHLTLARIRPPRDVGPLPAAAPAVTMPVEELVLYRSEPGAGAPRYEAVRSFQLR